MHSLTLAASLGVVQQAQHRLQAACAQQAKTTR